MTPEESYHHAKVAIREERIATLESQIKRMTEYDVNVRQREIDRLKQQCFDLQRQLDAARDDLAWWKRHAKTQHAKGDDDE